MVYSAYHNTVGISLQVEEWLQLLFKDIVIGIDSMRFELLAYNLLDKQVVRE
jgi:hypothetical protein